MSIIVARSAASCSVTTQTATGCFPGINKQAFIPSGNTVYADQVLTALTRAVKWFVVVLTADYSRMMAYEIYATHTLGASPTWVEYAVSDSTIIHDRTIIIDSSSLTLSITNNDTDDIVVFATRIIVPIDRQTPIDGISANITSTTGLLPLLSYVDIDSFVPDKLVGADWVVTISKVGNIRLTFHIFTYAAPGIPPIFVQYGDLGNTELNISTSVILVGSAVTLRITNASVNDYNVSLTRIPIGPTEISTCAIPISDINLWLPIPILIQPSEQGVVDAAQLPSHGVIDWEVCVNTPTTTMGFQVSATRQGLVTLSHNVYSIIGDTLNILIDCIMGQDLTLQLVIINNESVAITVTAIRIPTHA